MLVPMRKLNLPPTPEEHFHALVDKTGLVVATIVYDGNALYEPPDGLDIVQCHKKVRKGWIKTKDGFEPPAGG